MNIYIKVLMGVAVVGFFVVLWLLPMSRSAQVTTDRPDYSIGDPLEVSIVNKLDKSICFSSCYPFLLERQDSDGKWLEYSYGECESSDVVSGCVLAGESKKFQLSLDETEIGQTRIKINYCADCVAGQPFSAGPTLYSNTFIIK